MPDYDAFEGDEEFSTAQRNKATRQLNNKAARVMIVNMVLVGLLILCEVMVFIDTISSNNFSKDQVVLKAKIYALNGTALGLSLVLMIFLRCRHKCPNATKYFTCFLLLIALGLQMDNHFEFTKGLSYVATSLAMCLMAIIFVWFWFQVLCCQGLLEGIDDEQRPLNIGKKKKKQTVVSSYDQSTGGRTTYSEYEEPATKNSRFSWKKKPKNTSPQYDDAGVEAPPQSKSQARANDPEDDGLTEEERAWRGD